ncbi:MAG: preprotein translocase subunit YajC [Clostridia bacterium]|nr:preprotein translocase subunit YajC [Clostridia bacterium]
MYTMLLAAGEEAAKTPIWNYVLIGVVALLLIAMPIMMNMRNKKESQKVQEQTNSLKVGDEVLTTSGVYGTITEIKFDDAKKVVVIETGGQEKSYMAVDAYAIYTVFTKDTTPAESAPVAEEVKVEEPVVESVVEEKAEVATPEEVAKKPAKKTTSTKAPAKKSTGAKTTKKA